MTAATQPNTSLAQRLRNRESLLGTLLRMPNDALVELTGLVGMDFVVIDTEHGPADQIPLSQHLMAAAAAGIPALVRVGHISEILRVLDLGAAGIIAPHISTVEQGKAVVRAASYPPKGDRGFATYSRSGRHGLIGTAEHLDNAATRTAIILMIEDGPGVEAAEQIAAVDGVDALFVGPADLSVALGFPGEQGSDHVQAAIRATHDAARRAGVAVVTIAGGPSAAREQFAAGSNMVIYNVLAALGGLFTTLAGAKPGRSPAAPASTGSGNPVVMLAGMLAGGEVWNGVVNGLDPHVPVRSIRIDLDDSVAGMAESVLAQAPERFAIVGHSLGGIVALEIVRRAPERVSRLALVNCSGRGPSDGQLAAWSAQVDDVRAGRFDALVEQQAMVNLGPAAADAEQIKGWVRSARSVGPQGFLRQLSAQATRPDSLPTLSAIHIPTLVVSGELDAVCPPPLQAELAAGIPGARHRTLPGAGHMSPMDSAPELARMLREFFTS